MNYFRSWTRAPNQLVLRLRPASTSVFLLLKLRSRTAQYEPCTLSTVSNSVAFCRLVFPLFRSRRVTRSGGKCERGTRSGKKCFHKLTGCLCNFDSDPITKFQFIVLLQFSFNLIKMYRHFKN